MGAAYVEHEGRMAACTHCTCVVVAAHTYASAHSAHGCMDVAHVEHEGSIAACTHGTRVVVAAHTHLHKAAWVRLMLNTRAEWLHAHIAQGCMGAAHVEHEGRMAACTHTPQ
eukprot:1150796-Pelagomonas_calceolata.AAC.17